ncbi:MAG: hypothetical protein ACFFD2_11115, partial [Promethearchaeota archaeon]
GDRIKLWMTTKKEGTPRDIPFSKVNPRGGIEYHFTIPVEGREINARQYQSLKRFEKKQIRQKAKLGDTAPVYHEEGFLEFIEMKEEKKVKIPATGTQCDICEKTFKNRGALNLHYTKCARERQTE